MLTADLVTARRRGAELRLVPLDDAGRARAAALAQSYLDIARAYVGRSRDQLESAWDSVPVAAPEQRLAAGVRKLVGDRCLFGGSPTSDTADLRRQLFAAAFAVRRALPAGEPFVRDDVLATVAAERAVAVADLERDLYADLHGAELLLEIGPLSPERLATDFDLAQAQGVLLRAVRVVAEVTAADPAIVRALFRKLKFLRLLYRIGPKEKGGYRIELDGPFSLFQSVTRYGLSLALALPSVVCCDRWRLEADVLWGQQRQPVRFLWAGDASGGTDVDPSEAPAPALPDDVAALLRDINDLGGDWVARVADKVLDLPGAGLCVPDLVFEHRTTGRQVFLEVLGFWSREAVWRRIDLVRAGLPHPIVFAVSKNLRVSEAALDGDVPSGLYVYSRVMSARAILTRVNELAVRAD